MATEEREHGPATRVAIRNLSGLKPEHQDLLRTLLADPGMGSGTLETLVEHLLEEEDPRLTRELARVRAGSSAPEIARPAARPGSTVGSLRPDAAAHGVPSTVGASGGGSALSRGTVGSLRKP